MNQTSARYGLGPLEALWRRRRGLALVSFALPLVSAAALLVALPDIYRARVLVLVDDGAMLGRVDLDARVRRFTEENLSHSHLAALVERYDLYPALRRSGSMQLAVERLLRDIEIDRKDADPGGRAAVGLEITYRGRPPATVARVTQDLGQFYLDIDCRERQRETAATTARLETQLRSVEERLQGDEARVRSFIDSHLYELPQQAGANLAALERLGREAQRAPPPGADDMSGMTPGDTEALARAKRELADLKTRYTERHPDVMRVRQEIAALTGRSEDSRDDTLSSEQGKALPAKVGGGSEQELRQRRAIAIYEGRLYSAPKRQQELDALLMPYQSTKALYQALLQQHEDARFASSLDCDKSPIFRIADPAVVPRAPIAPDRVRMVLAGLLSALLGAVAAVVFAEQIDTSFHSREELRAAIGKPLLATIPRIGGPVERRRVRRRLLVYGSLCLFTALAVLMATLLVARDNDRLVWMLARGF